MTVTELKTITTRIDAEAAKIDALALKVDQVITMLTASRGGSIVGGAGTPTALAITTQPVGAASGVALGTQPIVRIVDNVGATCTTATNTVTASLASGSGILSGTVAVAAVAGVATFTNLVITGAGTDTIQFSASGLSGVVSGSVTISPQGSGLWPNLPGGMTILRDDEAGYTTPPTQADGAWTGMPQTGNPLGWGTLNPNGYLSVVTDATAPINTTKILRAKYPSGFVGGPGVGTCYYFYPNATEMYWSVIWKVASPYTFSNSQAQKVCQAMWADYANPASSLVCELGGSSFPAEFKIVPSNFPVDTTYHAGTGAGTTATGVLADTWYMIEYYAKYSTGAGHVNADGILKEWVSKWNGSSWDAAVLNINLSNIQYPNNAGGNLFELYTGWSGTLTKPLDEFVFYGGNILAKA